MLVSVIIPAYNALRWLPETLESVAAQDYPRLEVIIVDDGSTDDTAAYVRDQWPHYTLIRTENHGVSHARNLGTAKATGDLIQYLDADDLLTPGKISRQAALLQAHPEADVVYGSWQRLVPQGEGFQPGEIVSRAFEEADADAETAFFVSMWCPTGAYLYRRSLVEKTGGWKDWLPVTQDARFAWDCARAGARWLHDPEVGVLYRQHQGGSVSTKSRLAFLRDCWANAEDIRVIWAGEGTLQGRRLAVMEGVYHNLARSFFAVDRDLFLKARARLLELNPGFRPPERGLRLAASLMGYEAAEHVAGWYRRARQRLQPLLNPSCRQ
jgi:glycosyltransferase involved in cell wall biosynthesis